MGLVYEKTVHEPVRLSNVSCFRAQLDFVLEERFRFRD